jgi:hypothetical protein
MVIRRGSRSQAPRRPPREDVARRVRDRGGAHHVDPHQPRCAHRSHIGRDSIQEGHVMKSSIGRPRAREQRARPARPAQPRAAAASRTDVGGARRAPPRPAERCRRGREDRGLVALMIIGGETLGFRCGGFALAHHALRESLHRQPTTDRRGAPARPSPASHRRSRAAPAAARRPRGTPRRTWKCRSAWQARIALARRHDGTRCPG